jgi:hypothetical protein
LSDPGHILADFQTTFVSAIFRSESKIPNKNELPLKLDPELSIVLLPLFKCIQYFIDNMNAVRGMTPLYLSANDGETSGENPFLPLGIVSDSVVLINNGQIKR